MDEKEHRSTSKPRELALRLYRSVAFGEELDDSWAEAVLATAEKRRVSVDRVITELVLEAEPMFVTDEGSPPGDHQRTKAA